MGVYYRGEVTVREPPKLVRMSPGRSRRGRVSRRRGDNSRHCPGQHQGAVRRIDVLVAVLPAGERFRIQSCLLHGTTSEESVTGRLIPGDRLLPLITQHLPGWLLDPASEFVVSAAG